MWRPRTNAMKNIYMIIMILTSVTFHTNAQWTLTTTSPPATGPIGSLKSDGVNLFGGSNCFTGNIFRTADNGNSWSNTINGLPVFQGISCMTVFDSKIFTGLSESTTNSGIGVFKSMDNGDNWALSNTGIPLNIPVTSIEAHNNTLFAGVPTYGVYTSTDEGNTWINSSIGLGSTTQFYSFAFNGTNIFVGTNHGVFKSTDNGNSWVQSSNGLPGNGLYFTMGAIGNNIFAATYGATLYRSADNGANWNVAYSGNTFISDIVISGSKVFLAIDEYVLMSSDSGLTWVNTGYNATQVHALTASDTYLFAAEYVDIWKLPLSQLTSIDEAEHKKDVRIFPNPFSTTTNISFNEEQNNIEIRIVDVLGNNVQSCKFSGKIFKLDAKAMKKGIYFVYIKAKDKHSIKKIIVK